MSDVLVSTHIALCALALYSGAIVVFGLLANRLIEKWAVFFLRCSLISNIAALFLQFHSLLPAQKIAMAAVYCTGIAVLAWTKFHLRGPWRATFAFTTAIVLYFNFLGLSIQFFEHAVIASSLAPIVFRLSQVSLLAVFLFLGTVAARRFTAQPSACPSITHTSMGGAVPHLPVAR